MTMKYGDQQAVVEGAELVEMLEGLVGVVRLPVVAEALGGEQQPEVRGGDEAVQQWTGSEWKA